MAEIPFEYLMVALEGTRGTPETDATHYLNVQGMITPRQAMYRPEESRGTLAEFYRSVAVRRWADFEGEGGLDPYTATVLYNTLIAGGIDGTGATAADIVIDPGVANTAINYEADTAGSTGNQISIQYVDPDANSSPLDVDVVGQQIVVYLATDGAGVITSTGATVLAAVNGHPVAGAMVTATHHGGSDGSGVVTAMPLTYLTGGIGADVVHPDPAATSTYLWTFEPTMTADDLEAMTMFWGDPNVEIFRAGFCMPDSVTISADATGTDGVTISIDGQGAFPSLTAPGGILPTMLDAPLMMPAAMQLWIDSGATAIGTTAITGRVLSAVQTLPTGISRKWSAQGPGGNLSFQNIGRGKRHAELTVTFELPDDTQYAQFVAQTVLKVRLRLNGPLIETAGGSDWYFYDELDIYGPFDALEWGEHEGTNRTIELTIQSEYDATAGHDFAKRVQSDRGTL